MFKTFQGVTEDAKDNVYPRKESNDQKIDGIVALIMAIKQSIVMNVETVFIDSDTSDDFNLVL